MIRIIVRILLLPVGLASILPSIPTGKNKSIKIIETNSNRYLYHTPRDDIHHTSAISVQHMGNNLFSMVKYSCTDARLSKLSRKPTAKETDGVLASASFVFYDCLGSMMILFSHAGNLVIVSMLLVCTVAGFVAWNYFIERKGLRMYMIPTLKAYAIVWASVGMGLFLVYLLSMIKVFDFLFLRKKTYITDSN